MINSLYILISITVVFPASQKHQSDYDRVLTLVNMREYSQAAELLKDISPQDPLLGRLNILAESFADALTCDLSPYQLGWVYQRLQKYREAIESYQKAGGVLYSDARYKCGECASIMGDTTNAISYFEQAGDFLDSKRRLALLYESQEKYPEALSIWGDIGGPESVYKTAEIYESAQGKADSLYHLLIENFPGTHHALKAIERVEVEEYKMADVLFRNGRYKEVLKYIPQVDHLRRAQCLEGIGEYLDAAAQYRLARDHVKAGECLQEAGLFQEAIDEYLSSNSDKGLYNAGLLYERLGDIDEAIEVYGRTISSYRSIANLRRGILLLQQNEIDLAKTCFQNTFHTSGNYWLYRLTGESACKSHIENRASLSYYSYLLDTKLDISDIPPEEWIASFCDTNYTLSSDDSLRLYRGSILLRYGILDEARRELTSIEEDNPLFRYRLALLAHQGGMDEVSFWRAWSLIKGGDPPYPRKLMHLAYPLYHLPKVLRYEDEYPLLFMALIRAESHFYPEAVSPSNAIGLTQVIPSTGEGIARQLGINPFYPESLKDPETSIRFGLNYFNYCMQRFNGMPEYALAAYNGGPTRASRWMKDIPIEQWVELIPRDQTRLYVKGIMASYHVYKQLYRDLQFEELRYPADS